MFRISNICFSRKGRTLFENTSFTLEPNKIVGIVGPNGSGKTTLLRLLLASEKINSGKILLKGKNIYQMSRREIAQNVAYLPQGRPFDLGQCVIDLVMLGRICHHGLWSTRTQKDKRLAEDAIENVGLSGLKNCGISQLSGGELQRVMIARTLCQDTDIMFFDEPTNYLDIKYQIAILDLIQKLRRTTLIVLHDLNLAARFCDRIMLLDQGGIRAIGTPHKVLTEENLSSVYQIKMSCIKISEKRMYVTAL